jgi:hypothetical protein
MRYTFWGTQVESSMCFISNAHFHSQTCPFAYNHHILGDSLLHHVISSWKKIIMHLRAQPSNDHHLRNWICIGMYTNNNNNNNKRQTLNTQQKIQSFKLMSFLQIINPVKENHSQHSKSSQAGPIYPFMWYLPITDSLLDQNPKKICQHLSTRFSRPCHYNWSIHCHTGLLPWFKHLSLSSLTAFSLLPLLVAEQTLPPTDLFLLFSKTKSHLSSFLLEASRSHLTPTIQTDPEYHNSTLASFDTFLLRIIGLFWRSNLGKKKEGGNIPLII